MEKRKRGKRAKKGGVSKMEEGAKDEETGGGVSDTNNAALLPIVISSSSINSAPGETERTHIVGCGVAPPFGANVPPCVGQGERGGRASWINYNEWTTEIGGATKRGDVVPVIHANANDDNTRRITFPVDPVLRSRLPGLVGIDPHVSSSSSPSSPCTRQTRKERRRRGDDDEREKPREEKEGVSFFGAMDECPHLSPPHSSSSSVLLRCLYCGVEVNEKEALWIPADGAHYATQMPSVYKTLASMESATERRAEEMLRGAALSGPFHSWSEALSYAKDARHLSPLVVLHIAERMREQVVAAHVDPHCALTEAAVPRQCLVHHGGNVTMRQAKMLTSIGFDTDHVPAHCVARPIVVVSLRASGVSQKDQPSEFAAETLCVPFADNGGIPVGLAQSRPVPPVDSYFMQGVAQKGAKRPRRFSAGGGGGIVGVEMVGTDKEEVEEGAGAGAHHTSCGGR